MTAKELASFQNNLKALKTLDLSQNSLGDAGAIDISHMQNLVNLDLRTNNIGAEGGKDLPTTQSIATLYLSNNSPPKPTVIFA